MIMFTYKYTDKYTSLSMLNNDVIIDYYINFNLVKIFLFTKTSS